MDVTARLEQCTKKFDKLNAKRMDLLAAAEDCQAEMNCLRGEHRVLQELSEDQPQDGDNKDPLTITAEEIA